MKYEQRLLTEDWRQELTNHCEDEISALKLSHTISCLSETEIHDIEIGIATHEVALKALSKFDYESPIAGMLESVRDSLQLTPHQNAVINCAIERLNQCAEILNRKPSSGELQ